MPWLVLLATGTMIAVNALANALPIGGRNTGQIADGFEILFTPAGYVFSIWGLIYLSLMGFSVFQALPSRRDDPLVKAVRPWYVLNAAANASWIFAWHHLQFPLSLAIMLVILGSLVVIYRRVVVIAPAQRAMFWFLRAPFSLYLGWISIALIANATVVTWDMGVTAPLQSVLVTLALLGAATAVCVSVAIRFRDPVYAGVFVWALVGVAAKHQDLGGVAVGALVLAAVCAGAAVNAAFASRRGAAG